VNAHYMHADRHFAPNKADCGATARRAEIVPKAKKLCLAFKGKTDFARRLGEVGL